MHNLIINNTSELKNFVADFAHTLNGGEIIGLVGDLGAGKTTFTKYLAAELGVTREVKSPTFIVLQIFNTKHATIKRLVHIDAYRLKNYAELLTAGFLDYANLKDTLVVIEWADLVPEIKNLPSYKEIQFKFGLNNSRFLSMA